MGSYGIDEKRSARHDTPARIDTEALHHFAQKDELALRLGHKTHGGLSFSIHDPARRHHNWCAASHLDVNQAYT
jgi:hypothetical protein